MVPGRRSRNVSTGGAAWCRDLRTDLHRLRERYHTTVLASLMQSHEYSHTDTAALFQLAPRHGIDLRWHPIPDHGVPPSVETFDAFVEHLIRACARGENVVAHCKAGKGRAPLTVASMLVRRGASVGDAVRTVQAVRRGSLTNTTQVEYLHYYRRFLNGERGPVPDTTSTLDGAWFGH